MSFPAILVASHEPNRGEVLSEILMDEGYPHVVVAPAEEVWSLVTQMMPGLVLLDMSLRSAAGWTVLAQLRRHPPTATLPIILCTTNPDVLTDLTSMLNSLHCSLLAKPFAVSELLALVVELLGPPLAMRELGTYQHDAPYAAHCGTVLP